MTEQSATPEGGPLSVDEAVASLISPPPEANDTPEAAPAEAAAEDEKPEGETSAPEEADDGAETPAEGEEADAEEPVAVEPAEPPRYWSKDAKDAFAKLPADLQAVVLSQEGPREEATAKAKADAAAVRALADAELNKVEELAKGLSQRLPQWIKAFEARWGTETPDWVGYAQAHGVEAMTLAKTQFEAEQDSVRSAAAETAKAQGLAHQTFVQNEWRRLAEIEPELAPDLSDPRKGAETRQKVTTWLTDKGVPREALAQISAIELSIAYDAMRWREAQAAIKVARKPKPAASAQSTSVRPAAGQAQPSSQRTAQTAANRFAQTRSVDDAVALLLAKG